MKRKTIAGLLASAITWAAVTPVSAQTSSGPEGRNIAIEICSECHSIENNDRASKNIIAPAFSAIAHMPSTTLLSIKVFLKTPHATMPNIMLSEAEIDAIAEYILGLKRG